MFIKLIAQYDCYDMIVYMKRVQHLCVEDRKTEIKQQQISYTPIPIG